MTNKISYKCIESPSRREVEALGVIAEQLFNKYGVAEEDREILYQCLSRIGTWMYDGPIKYEECGGEEYGEGKH